MSLFTPDTSGLNSFEEKGKFLMAWRFSLAFCLLFGVMVIVSINYSATALALYAVIASVSVGALFYLKYTKDYFKLFIIYCSTGTILTQISLNSMPELTHYTDCVWIFVLVVFAFISINKLAGWIFLVVNIIGLCYFIIFVVNNHIETIEALPLYSRITNAIELIIAISVMGYFVYQHLLFQDHSRLQLKKLNFNLEQQNEAVISRNKENITLIKEVHHRVKNNLQIIISLLRMQRSEIKSEENREQFTVAINRILTMSLIHQKLYQEKEPSRININDYIKDLSYELLSVSNRRIALNVESNDEHAGLKTIVPFGLLVNELISNTLKHAYIENQESKIDIQIKAKNKHEIAFKYEDNGTWIEPVKDAGSFGLELIDVLTEQLDGSYTRDGSKYSFIINTQEES